MYCIYQCVICVVEYNIRVGQNGICIGEYNICVGQYNMCYCLHFVILFYDNDLGERYRAVTSYKYFRTKMFPCIFYMKEFFIDNYYYFSIDFHEILSIKCRNEYSFYSSHNLHIILFLLLLTIWFDSPNITM